MVCNMTKCNIHPFQVTIKFIIIDSLLVEICFQKISAKIDMIPLWLQKLTQDEEESDNNTDTHDNDDAADVNASTSSEADDGDSNKENREDDVTASEAE